MPENKEKKIEDYYRTSSIKPPSLWLAEAVGLLKEKGEALDFGCGAGRDTKALLELGFKVTAIDYDPKVETYLKRLPRQDNLIFICIPFEEFNFPIATYNLINAAFSIPYTPRDKFNNVFDKMKKSLKKDGIFVGQLFGAHDDWAKSPTTKTTFHTKEEVQLLFSDMELIRLIEKDYDGTLSDGTPKHWHSFHIIARKK